MDTVTPRLDPAARPRRPATLGARFDPRANNFDLLRLLLAALVIASHCFSLLGRPDEPVADVLHYGTGGQLAVAAFLVVSGFLVARSAEASDLDRYVLSRAVRILPGLAVVTLAEIFVIGIAYSSATPWIFLTYVGFRHLWNLTVFGLDARMYSVFEHTDPPWLINGSLWTIPIECSFYILLPLALALPRRRLVFPALFLASLVATRLAAAAGWDDATPGPALAMNVHAFHVVDLAPYFLAGAAAWILRDRIPITRGGVALALIGLYAARGFTLAPEALELGLPYLVLAFAVAGAAGSRLKRRVGDLSYGMYLFGFPLTLCLIRSVGPTSPYRLALAAIAASAACAWLSWHLVERPCLRLRTRPATTRPDPGD